MLSLSDAFSASRASKRVACPFERFDSPLTAASVMPSRSIVSMRRSSFAEGKSACQSWAMGPRYSWSFCWPLKLYWKMGSLSTLDRTSSPSSSTKFSFMLRSETAAQAPPPAGRFTPSVRPAFVQNVVPPVALTLKVFVAGAAVVEASPASAHTNVSLKADVAKKPSTTERTRAVVEQATPLRRELLELVIVQLFPPTIAEKLPLVIVLPVLATIAELLPAIVQPLLPTMVELTPAAVTLLLPPPTMTDPAPAIVWSLPATMLELLPAAVISLEVPPKTVALIPPDAMVLVFPPTTTESFPSTLQVSPPIMAERKARV